MEASPSCAGVIVAAPCETWGTETWGGDGDSVRAVSGWVTWVAWVAWVAPHGGYITTCRRGREGGFGRTHLRHSRCRRCRRRGHLHRRHKALGFTHGSISRGASRTRSRRRPSLHGRCTFGRSIPPTPRSCACRCRGVGRLLHVSDFVGGPCSLTLGSCSCNLKRK
jgi:hypothetical protein